MPAWPNACALSLPISIAEAWVRSARERCAAVFYFVFEMYCDFKWPFKSRMRWLKPCCLIHLKYQLKMSCAPSSAAVRVRRLLSFANNSLRCVCAMAKQNNYKISQCTALAVRYSCFFYHFWWPATSFDNFWLRLLLLPLVLLHLLFFFTSTSSLACLVDCSLSRLRRISLFRCLFFSPLARSACIRVSFTLFPLNS